MITYLETSILVALALGLGDRHYAGAVGVLDAARRADCRVITSQFAILEAIGIIRRRAAAAYRCRSGDDLERADVDRHMRGAVARLRQIVNGMEEDGFLTVVGMKGWFLDLPTVHNKMFEHPGYAVLYSKGNSCRHRGLGLLDWLHIILARDANAAVICTTDMAFADIAGNDDEFGHIQTQLADGAAAGPLYDLARGGAR